MKYKKETKKREKEEKERQLSQNWGMLEWVTNFIQENQDNWEKEIKEKEKHATKELDEWNKCKRLEKIEMIRKKKNWQQQKETEPVRPDPPKIPPPPKKLESMEEKSPSCGIVCPYSPQQLVISDTPIFKLDQTTNN